MMGLNQQLQLWCSWLSRSPHTREVPGSSPGSCIFVFIIQLPKQTTNKHRAGLPIPAYFSSPFMNCSDWHIIIICFFLEEKSKKMLSMSIRQVDDLNCDNVLIWVIVQVVIIVWMGSGLCPGATKDIIQQLSQIQKGEKIYSMFFKVCLGLNELGNESQIERIDDLTLNIRIPDQQHQGVLFKQKEDSQNIAFNDQKLEDVEEGIEIVQFVFEDGSKYVGRIQDHLPHGLGQEYLASGDYYKGEFRFGVKEGLGEYRFANFQKYEGQFRQNMMWGKGKYIFANGDCYVGEFHRNQRSGKGQYLLGRPTADGLRQFEGLYNDDLKEGEGTLIYKGEKVDGKWKKGLFEFALSTDLIR